LPLMVVRTSFSFKALAHKAARLTSVSAKAGLGAMIVTTEVSAIKPTVAIASMTVGASAASIRKALKVSAFEREMLIGGALTLGELTPVEDIEAEMPLPEALIGFRHNPVSAEQVHEKRVLFGSSRMTVDDVLEVYTNMTPSEQIALGRAIGIERVWLPRQRKREHNGGIAFA
jgi:hypothetical protein